MPAGTIVRTAINVWFGTTATIEFPPGGGGEMRPLPPELKHTLATRYDIVFLQTDYSEVRGYPPDYANPPDFTVFAELGRELKAMNPSIKVGMYTGAISGPRNWDIPYPWLLPEDQLHRLDGTPAEILPHGYRSVNYTRAATVAKLIANWRAFLADHDMDCMLYDIWDPPSAASHMASAMGCPTGGLEGPVHTEAWWADALIPFTVELSAALEADGMEMWVNALREPGTDPGVGSDHVDQLVGPDQVRASAYGTGSLSESSYPHYVDPTRFARYLTQRDQVRAAGGRVFWFQQPTMFNHYYPEDPITHVSNNPFYPLPPGMDRFYLAAHLIGDDGSRNDAYGYHDQEEFRGWLIADPSTLYVFDGGNDWDVDPGLPTGNVVWDAAVSGVQVVSREYEHAWAVANPNRVAGWFRVPGVYRDWDPDTGPVYIVSSDSPYLSVDGGAGRLLFKQAVPVTLWSVPMRARLMHVAQDEDGNVLPGRAVTLYRADGVTLFDQVLYDAPSGGAVVTAPSTDGLGRLTLYADIGVRVKLAVGGILGQYDSEFSPDPEDLRQTTQPVVIDDVPGDAVYLVEMRPTVGGAGGNKAMLVLNADGTTLLALRPHGLAGVSNGLATDTAAQVNRLLLVDPNNPPRILGDLSNATVSRRVVVQSSVPNGQSDLAIAPNGTGTRGAISVLYNSNLDATSGARLYAEAGGNAVTLETFGTGGSPAQPLYIRPNQTASLVFATSGSILQPGELPCTATAGFLYLASMPGSPTATPAAATGLVPLVFDGPSNKLFANFGGTWRSVQFT